MIKLSVLFKQNTPLPTIVMLEIPLQSRKIQFAPMLTPKSLAFRDFSKIRWHQLKIAQ